MIAPMKPRQQESKGFRAALSKFWQLFRRWLYWASPVGQCNSHPVAGVISIVMLAFGGMGFVHWVLGLPAWEPLLGMAAILGVNALLNAALKVGCEVHDARRREVKHKKRAPITIHRTPLKNRISKHAEERL